MGASSQYLGDIDTAGGSFRSAARHGVRFEIAVGPRRHPSSGDFACSYQYRLISPGSGLAYWRTERMLARFTGVALGPFPPARRLEQVWLAIHRAEATVTARAVATDTPFAVFLTLGYPWGRATAADPELVKALIDGTTAAFQAHGDRSTLGEIARRVASATSHQADAVTAMLGNEQRAVLGTPGRLAYLRAAGVQWNPGDHMCTAGQLTCEPADQDEWTLAGEIHEISPAPAGHPD